MNYTPNYNLNKPEADDFYDIDDFNTNADKIDELLKAQADAIGNRVEKVAGKGLSTNDYTTDEKNKLAGVEAGANKTTVTNNLTSTSATNALSAGQGKVLWENITDVATYAVYQNKPRTVLNDFNEVNTNGISVIHDYANNIKNSPEPRPYAESQWWEVEFWGDVGRGVQIAHGCYTHMRKSYIRYVHDAVWSDWTTYSNKWELIGSVTGANSVAIDSTKYSEFLVVTEYSSEIASIVIPSIALTSSSKYYGGGEYRTTTSHMAVVINATSSSINIHDARRNGSAITNASTMTVYGRR